MIIKVIVMKIFYDYSIATVIMVTVTLMMIFYPTISNISFIWGKNTYSYTKCRFILIYCTVKRVYYTHVKQQAD